MKIHLEMQQGIVGLVHKRPFGDEGIPWKTGSLVQPLKGDGRKETVRHRHVPLDRRGEPD